MRSVKTYNKAYTHTHTHTHKRRRRRGRKAKAKELKKKNKQPELSGVCTCKTDRGSEEREVRAEEIWRPKEGFL